MDTTLELDFISHHYTYYKLRGLFDFELCMIGNEIYIATINTGIK